MTPFSSEITRLAQYLSNASDYQNLCDAVTKKWQHSPHGDWPKWSQVLSDLPAFSASQSDLTLPAITVTGHSKMSADTVTHLRKQLKLFSPWRKGPFQIDDIYIDSEWRSDLKWARLAERISPLGGRRILDVGCGNCYYGWRMAAASPALVLGIDPFILYGAQYHAIRHFCPIETLFWLPLGLEEFPQLKMTFDTVFSMGVLYHRKSPIDHLQQLRKQLRVGGELVLETLVIEGNLGEVLVPPNRYAGMRNVWFIPSIPTLIGWLERCGFKHIQLVDETATSSEEQRSTDWMTFHSLIDFLDPEQPHLTVEGLPAPRRASILATAQ